MPKPKVDKFSEIEDCLDMLPVHDWGLTIEVANECAWSAELRLTPQTNPDGCDESIVFYAANCDGPLEALERVYEAATQKLDKE